MSKENLLLIEDVLDGEKSKEDREIILDGLKDQIKEFEKDADADFQKEIDRVKSKFGIGGAKKKATPKVEKKPTPKAKAKTTKKPRAKTTPEQRAKNREKVQNATGKTIEECKEILAKYEALRGKTTQKDKQRVDKLKDEDKIIDGTNVKTADAITETTAKQVPKKIKQEVDAIEKEAEQEAKKEVNPKGKTKAEVKKEVEEVKIEKIEEKVKDMTKDLADKSNELIDAMTNTIKKLSPSKEEAIKFLMDIRNHVDVLLKSNKFEFGGAVQSYDIAWAGGGRPMPMFEKGGKFDDDKLKIFVGEKEYNKGYPVYLRYGNAPKETISFHKSKENAEKKANLLRGQNKSPYLDEGRYSILGVSKSAPYEKPTLHSSVNNRSEIKEAVEEAKKDFKGLTRQEHEIFVTDNKEDRRIYNYSKGGTTRKKGLGWKRDRERLSKEPHEQAYKSKRKGDYSSFERGGYYGGDGEEYIYPSEEERIDEMAKHWNSEGWASSSVSKQGDDGEFFDKIGVDSDEVGITSQTGNDIIYYDVNRPSYFNRDFAKGGKTNWVQDVVDSPNFREGAFTRKAEARGMSTDAFMNQVLHSPNLYDERTRKQAQFMKNAFND